MFKVDCKGTKRKLVVETRQLVRGLVRIHHGPSRKVLFIVNKNTRLRANQLNGVCRSGLFMVSFEHIWLTLNECSYGNKLGLICAASRLTGFCLSWHHPGVIIVNIK